MTWGEESPELEQALEAALAPARRLEEEQFGLLGVGASAPEVDAIAEGAGDTAVEASLGSAAWHAPLRPRHRRAVRTFFGPATANPEDGKR